MHAREMARLIGRGRKMRYSQMFSLLAVFKSLTYLVVSIRHIVFDFIPLRSPVNLAQFCTDCLIWTAT